MTVKDKIMLKKPMRRGEVTSSVKEKEPED